MYNTSLTRILYNESVFLINLGLFGSKKAVKKFFHFLTAPKFLFFVFENFWIVILDVIVEIWIGEDDIGVT